MKKLALSQMEQVNGGITMSEEKCNKAAKVATVASILSCFSALIFAPTAIGLAVGSWIGGCYD